MIAADYAFHDADLPGGYLVLPAIPHGLINYSFEDAIGSEWTLGTGASRSSAHAANGGTHSCALTGGAGQTSAVTQDVDILPVTDERDYWHPEDLLPIFARFFAWRFTGAEPLQVDVQTLLLGVTVEAWSQTWDPGADTGIKTDGFGAYRAGPFIPTDPNFDAIRVLIGVPSPAAGTFVFYIDDVMVGAMLDTNDLHRRFFEDGVEIQRRPDTELNRMEDGTPDGWLFNDGQREGKFSSSFYDDTKRIDIVEPFDLSASRGTPVTLVGNGATLQKNFIPEVLLLLQGGKRGQDEQDQMPDWKYSKSFREVG